VCCVIFMGSVCIGGVGGLEDGDVIGRVGDKDGADTESSVSW
jgi:hypothetical protein